MATDFLDTLFSKEYIKATTKVKEGKEAQTKGLIFIENEADQAFWEKLLGKKHLSRYDFSMASGPGMDDNFTRGKKRFYKNLERANEYAIFAIDADFAQFTPNRDKYHAEILKNKHVIHTNVYSKESVLFCIDNLNQAIEKYRHQHAHGQTFTSFIEVYSNTIYRPLINFLFSFNEKIETLNEEEFHKVITPDPDTFITGDWSTLEESVSDFMKHNDYSSHKRFEEFIESTKAFGLNNDTAYQYISGHHLEKKIIKDALNSLKKKIIAEFIDTLEKGGVSSRIIHERRKEIENHFRLKCCFPTLIEQSTSHLNGDVHKLISSQFSNMLS
ncbi:TPA: DUF4435 domain-containing protein [Vibrio parahaemolyticus]|uniref:DUF4435 domain-containing protein n=1 Tax=Vibrio parahaemolyticus TaxID=670 RepID=UPI000A3A30D4|nr:DUF4435 domain-containing protein [Vibrio parahaemolyticus]EJG1628776.1 DUF4435 domain-containing protein [Vibrio parahaemolyticus]MDF4643327.1 DUF4435 domain-containing protein [Vibrio parahaemolyticus]MDF4702813.1 DUF4435 domain-containing protein [Vibrio parahaemolyticus]OUD53849.1 hypothetical protein BTA15_01300 [Vibrio parahaemolyticus]TOF55368.1 DUF4435 domain-containing protein [Vibrio parahaemolyticus]